MARSKSAAKAGFLPEGLRVFLIRRLIELGGLAVVGLGLGLLLALVSFHPQDPTLNRATAAGAENWLGWPGAYLADILLQTVGLAALVPVALLFIWGWRILSHQGLPNWPLHVTLFPVALILIAGAFAALPTPDLWPYRTGFGGAIGMTLTLRWLTPLFVAMGLPAITLWAGMVCLLLGAVAFGYASALTGQQWRQVGAAASQGAVTTAKGVGQGAATAGGWAARMLARLGLSLGGWWATRRARAQERAQDAALIEAEPQEVVTIDIPLHDDDMDEEDAVAVLPHAAATPAALVEKRAPSPKPGRRAAQEAQPDLGLDSDGPDYRLPPLNLLKPPPDKKSLPGINEEALSQNAKLLETVLAEFGVIGQIVKVRPGPVVTLYELEPAPGTKSSRVIGLADDIARSMSALSARVAVIPGRNAIGIELPNAARETVYLRELFATSDFENPNNKLALALGKDIGGGAVIADLARMPHLLVAGTTGSGKSVAINTMILSLLYRLTPDQCRFIMVDPKMLELSVYDGIPHLLAPVVTEPQKAVVALKWTVREMEERYRKMSEMGVRNVAGYNQRVVEAQEKGENLSRTVQTGFDPETGKPVYEDQPLDMAPLPYIVVIVDELADLMLVAGKDIEAAIQRLAQMARAAGIHLIMATQRPSVDVITGTIKANFPTRISFQVTSKIDSRTILGEQGAEQLLGQGDMLYMPGAGRLTRVHGPFVSDEEVEKIVSMLKKQGAPQFIEAITAEPEETEGGFGMGGGEGGDGNDLYDKAVAIVLADRKASTSYIQRRLGIGYNRAANLIERMEREGLITAPNHVGKRDIIPGG